ncbi:hypothetical protein C9374_008587 [Naegleria lovaniensis]|uniref:Uncharacterized protein n=1 Tax=Naegleria lovaniensis TaxID=51637 RepID=A0AA88KFP3_NAELO|nr:uncharacterized protein C9374_008587 [Naegleria lovaniensis]KAG2377965.1 hypothetical protein C9374_008587 [Naegleria lovaniensis]
MVKLLLYGLSESGLSTLFHLFQLIPHTTPLVEESSDGISIQTPRSPNSSHPHTPSSLRSSPINIPNHLHHVQWQQQHDGSNSPKPFSFSSTANSLSSSSASTVSSFATSSPSVHHHQLPHQTNNSNEDDNHTGSSLLPSSPHTNFNFSMNSSSAPNDHLNNDSPLMQRVSHSRPLPRLPLFARNHPRPLPPARRRSIRPVLSNTLFNNLNNNDSSSSPPINKTKVLESEISKVSVSSIINKIESNKTEENTPARPILNIKKKAQTPNSNSQQQSTSTTSLLDQTSSFSPVTVLKKRRHAFSDAVLKALPYELLSQIFVCFRILIDDAEAKGFLYKTEEEFHQFLKQFTNLDKLKNTTSSSNTDNHDYCDYCHAMAAEKALVVMKEGKLSCQQLQWKLEKTFSIVERMKKIHEPQKLAANQRLRTEFFNDCKELWENHLGLQHTFHAYTLFKNNCSGEMDSKSMNGFQKEDKYLSEMSVQIGNAFSAFPSIMEHVVDRYLLKMPSKMFGFGGDVANDDDHNDASSHNSTQLLGEGISNSETTQMPSEIIILLNSMVSTGSPVENNAQSSTTTEYNFKFNLPPLSEIQSSTASNSSSTTASDPINSQELGNHTILITQEAPTFSQQPHENRPGEHKKSCATVLSSSFTTTQSHTDYSKSDSTLLYSVNSHIYKALAGNHRGSATQEVVAAVRPLVLDKIQEQKPVVEEKKEPLSSPRRLLSFLKSHITNSNNTPTIEAHEPPPKTVKKPTPPKQKNTIFSIVTMGGINPKITFSKKEWIVCCYTSNAMVYVVNLCDFFKTIQVKDSFSGSMIEKNRLEYSLEKFEQCVNGKYFSDIPILLVFTFVDVFKEALKQFPLTPTRKNSLVHCVQQLNPAAEGQKQTEPKIPSIQHKFGDSKLEEWHSCCEFIIEQFIHVATSQERREEMRRNVVVLNCIDVKKSTQVLVNDIILNADIMTHLQFNEQYYGSSPSSTAATSSSTHGRTPSIHEKFKSSRSGRDGGPMSDRSHYRRPPLLNDTTADYSQYYYRRCKNVPLSVVSTNSNNSGNNSNELTSSKITKQRKRKEKQAKASLVEKSAHRLSWTTWGSWRQPPQERVMIVVDEVGQQWTDEEQVSESVDTTTSARRKRKNSNSNCLLQ